MVSRAEYFAADAATEWKCELVGGVVREMAYPDRSHGRILETIAVELGRQLTASPLHVMVSRMRIRGVDDNFYTFPDLLVTDPDARFESQSHETLLTPRLIIEIYSDATEAYDRGRKFQQYRQIASLQEYVLISQNEPHIELYSRHAVGGWLLTEAKGLEATIELPAIGCRLKLEDVYAKVGFRSE